MPVGQTNILNQTVTDVIQFSNNGSISVRLEKIDPNQYALITGVSFGFKVALASEIANFANAPFQIIKNEVFQPTYLYQNAVIDNKNVMFRSYVTQTSFFKDIVFPVPLLIDDSPNVLCILNAYETQNGVSTTGLAFLTVNGYIKNKLTEGDHPYPYRFR